MLRSPIIRPTDAQVAAVLGGGSLPWGWDGGDETPYWQDAGLHSAHFSHLGITTATGVSAWGDQSGKGNHLLQNTGSLQPAYDTAGGPNGRPSLAFDGGAGADDVMTGANGGNVGHLFVVAKYNAATWGSSDGLFSSAAFFAFTTKTTGTDLFDPASFSLPAGAIIRINGTITLDTTDPSVWVLYEMTDAAPDDWGAFRLGADRVGGTWDGDVAAVAVYTTQLPDAKAASVRAGFGAEYGISVS